MEIQQYGPDGEFVGNPNYGIVIADLVLAAMNLPLAKRISQAIIRAGEPIQKPGVGQKLQQAMRRSRIQQRQIMHNGWYIHKDSDGFQIAASTVGELHDMFLGSGSDITTLICVAGSHQDSTDLLYTIHANGSAHISGDIPAYPSEESLWNNLAVQGITAKPPAGHRLYFEHVPVGPLQLQGIGSLLTDTIPAPY